VLPASVVPVGTLVAKPKARVPARIIHPLWTAFCNCCIRAGRVMAPPQYLRVPIFRRPKSHKRQIEAKEDRHLPFEADQGGIMKPDRKWPLNAGVLMALALGVCGLSAAAPALAADSWPARTVRVIVPHPAGGPTDVVARIITKRLGEVLGKAFIVENRGGANGNIGAAAVASAAPDGYTLMFTTTGPLVFNKLIYKSTAFDPAKDFASIVKVSAIPLVVVANAGVPVKNISELVAYAKANPGKITYATPGNGSMGHLTAELLQKKFGIQMTHVPYKGSAPALNDILGGRVDLSFDLLPTYVEHIRSNTLKALAVTTLARTAELPQAATLAEQGMPKFEAVGWTALAGPAGLPPETIQKVNRVVNAFLASDEGKAALLNFGMEPLGGTPEDLAGYMASELTKWQPVAEKVTAE
jgi:tripartite-type tricarboxylate transporter receptor subunit TctC